MKDQCLPRANEQESPERFARSRDKYASIRLYAGHQKLAGRKNWPVDCETGSYVTAGALDRYYGLS